MSGMAVLLALILLPLIIGLGSMVSVVGWNAPLDEILIMLFVLALAVGVFYGMVRLMDRLEEPEPAPRR
jgi:hypothetical protein